MATPHKSKLLIFDTHPIQYRSPVFASLGERFSEFKVYFFNEQFDGNKWWFHEVGKIPDQNWEQDFKSGFSYHVMGTEHKGLVKVMQEISAILKKENPKAVAMYGYYLPEHWALWFVCRRLSIPLLFIGETFSKEGSNTRKRIKQVLHPMFFKGVSQCIAIGNKTEAFYRSFNLSDAKITSAKYCVDTEFFNLPETESKNLRRSFRKKLEIPDEAFVLLYVGRFFERKRPLDMVALHKSFLKDEDVFTLMVGNGEMESEVKEAISGIPRISLLGFQNQPEVRGWYHAADLLVVPSEYETWGLVINEAFACYTPALVTNTCGAADDLVVPGHTGYVYEVGDIDYAHHLAERLRENPFRLKRIAKTAYEKVTTEYGIDQFVRAMEKAVEAVTSSEVSA